MATPFLENKFQDAVNKTLGAIFVGFSVACCIYGILLSQVFGYFKQYPMDRVASKIMVLCVLVLETVDQSFIAFTIYWYSIKNFADPIVFIEAKMKWSLIVRMALFTAMHVTEIVASEATISDWVSYGGYSENLFCLKGLEIGRNIWITGTILLLTYAQLALGLVYTAKGFQHADVFSALRHLTLLGTVALGTAVLTDIVTAAALCFYLNRLRTGLQRADSLISSLSVYAINTGVLTSATSGGTLILYNVMPDQNLVFVALYFVTSKLYAVSLLATLNTRRRIRGRGTDHETETNNTNMFHLGTRIPTVGGVEAESYWDTRKVSFQRQPQVAPQDELQMTQCLPPLPDGPPSKCC